MTIKPHTEPRTESCALVAASKQPLSAEDLRRLEAPLDLAPADWQVLSATAWQRTVDVPTSALVPWQTKAKSLMAGVDSALIPTRLRQPKLLTADMDATLVVGESIDVMAEALGLRAQVEAITEQAMRGELDFMEAVNARLGLMKGLPVEKVAEIGESITLQPGAEAMMAALGEAGCKRVVVSGGFRTVVDVVAKRLGADEAHANTLALEEGKLAGTVIPPLVDKTYKLEQLKGQAAALGLNVDQCLAVGDGANDIDMLQAAGMGIGFQGKPIVFEATPYQIRHTDLTTVLAYAGIAV